MASSPRGIGDAVRQLEADLARVRKGSAVAPRTARLLGGGVPKMAKKLAEEAVEVALDAVRGERRAVVAETADLLYNLVVLLDTMGIRSEEVWAEMERRRQLFGIAEKLRKPNDDG
ncbi:MAG TPA: phosphoribosyl-ATP diphosphatase [Candidatus Dormibacteraeota bacterium]